MGGPCEALLRCYRNVGVLETLHMKPVAHRRWQWAVWVRSFSNYAEGPVDWLTQVEANLIA